MPLYVEIIAWTWSYCIDLTSAKFWCLTLALPGGGHLSTPPWWFFRDSEKTAARSAAKFGIPIPTSIPHIVCKFWTHITKGQVTRSGQVTIPQNVNSEVCNPTKPTVVDIETWHSQEVVSTPRATTCISRIFYIDDLRSGHFCDRPIISLWEKFQMPLDGMIFNIFSHEHVQ